MRSEGLGQSDSKRRYRTSHIHITNNLSLVASLPESQPQPYTQQPYGQHPFAQQQPYGQPQTYTQQPYTQQPCAQQPYAQSQAPYAQSQPYSAPQPYAAQPYFQQQPYAQQTYGQTQAPYAPRPYSTSQQSQIPLQVRSDEGRRTARAKDG